jgi:transcriptional regulator with XRE-family HTH domain
VRVGHQIRKRRLAGGLTLSQVAERSGLTIGGLSQIERGLVAPTIPTIQRIATALDTPVFSLFMEAESTEKAITRHDRRRILTLVEGNASYQVLSPRARRQFEVTWFTLEPEATTSFESLTHAGEEFCLILCGGLRFELGDYVYELAAGDSAQFDSAIPHRFVNDSGIRAEGIFVSCPPF